MARTISSMTSLVIVAVFLASLFQLASCFEPNLGFEASITVAQIQITSSDNNRTHQTSSFSSRNNASNYEFMVPVTITRRSSVSQALTLTLFTRPYDYDEDQAPREVQVYQQPIDMDGQQSYETTAEFNISTQSISTTVFYLRAQVDIDGGIGGNSTSYRSTVSGAVVLSYNSTTSSWMSVEPAEYAHHENVAIHEAMEAELRKVSEPPIDTTLDTVIDDQDPDLPEDDMTEVPKGNPPVEKPPGLVPSPINSPTPSVTVPTPGVTPSPGSLTPGVSPSPGSPTPGVTPSPGSPSPGTYPIPSVSPYPGTPTPGKDSPGSTQCAMQPPPPCPPPPPPPCPKALRYAPIHARQTSGNKGFLKLTLSYGTAAQPVPIRQLPVTALGVVNQRVLAATGKTDNKGFVSLQFPLKAGETILVYQVSVSLDAEKFRVSTSKDKGKTFLYWVTNSVPLTWQIPVGTTKDLSYRFMNKATNDIFNVQDRMLNSWIFAKTKVYNFSAKLPHIWFPGQVGPNYFSDPSAVGATVASAFINVHPDKAKATTPQAHEYGHWFHYLARRMAKVDYALAGESHNFCQEGTANSAAVSLTEGYATAFGLSALWQSPFQESAGNGYCWFPFDPAVADCLPIEAYECDVGVSARDLSFDEGRVAAVLRDLIDAAGDDNGGDPDRGLSGYSDASNLLRTRVLLDPMRGNPQSMEDYW